MSLENKGWSLFFTRKGKPPPIPMTKETSKLIIKMGEAEEPEEFRPIRTEVELENQEPDISEG
ncbi:MAG TPA: hypothetical protein VI795_01015 [Patescibacteria group bacterium]|nr:hypothetical protein [Patescibacteria group bacterium]